uniref:(northern house mosquito) hypothetical protein n=1 Tax=Culex pipiens TaxID=7175 RepID=A0A8D8NM46_CULPI
MSHVFCDLGSVFHVHFLTASLIILTEDKLNLVLPLIPCIVIFKSNISLTKKNSSHNTPRYSLDHGYTWTNLQWLWGIVLQLPILDGGPLSRSKPIRTNPIAEAQVDNNFRDNDLSKVTTRVVKKNERVAIIGSV